MKTKIVLIKPEYPYGKSQIHFGISLYVVAQQLKAAEYEVNVIDMNLHPLNLKQEKIIHDADFIGLTVTGNPNIPKVLECIERFSSSNAKIMVGGQPIEKMESDLFQKVFGKDIIQIKNDLDLANILGIEISRLASPFEISIVEIFKEIPENDLRLYLKSEITLFISQGCHYNCKFCVAVKGVKEKFKDINAFKEELIFLAEKAKSFNYSKLEFYATNLDFFQNPKKVLEYLDIVAFVKEKTEIDIRIRCLACITSFLSAHQTIPNLKTRCKKSGLWSIGFGVDGTDLNVWKAQKKTQNNLEDLLECLKITKDYKIRLEILFIMGFDQDNFKSLWKNFKNVCTYLAKNNHAILRPYLAKQCVPGSGGWKSFDKKDIFSDNPKLFYNMDFAVAGSKFTHPNFWHRLISNTAYLSMCGLFYPFGKCATSPLMPYGKFEIWNKFARWWNKIMPFDL